VIAEYDYVLLDSPPVLDASDALLYASATDATILVIRQAAVPRDVVAQAVAELEAVHVRFVGLVVNRAARSRDYVRTP
jgi:Mrp family chromosome partitioning ATPase